MDISKGHYYKTTGDLLDEKECNIISIAVPKINDTVSVSIKIGKKKLQKNYLIFK
jgi:hypothetical protein